MEVIFSKGKLEKIGFQSFKDCTNLIRIVLPDSLQTIDDGAFTNCNKIVCGGLTLPERLKEQAKRADIQEMPLSDGCLNNFRALFRKKTCVDNKRRMRAGITYTAIIIGSLKV